MNDKALNDVLYGKLKREVEISIEELEAILAQLEEITADPSTYGIEHRSPAYWRVYDQRTEIRRKLKERQDRKRLPFWVRTSSDKEDSTDPFVISRRRRAERKKANDRK